MRTRLTRPLLALTYCCALLIGQSLAPVEQALTNQISAASMEGHVAFLASDLLEGRDTPSKGLDIAAEYIASQYRRFGLEHAAQGSYFQVADYVVTRQNLESFELVLDGGQMAPLRAPHDRTGIVTTAALDFKDLALVKVSVADEHAELPARESLEDKAVLLVMAPARSRTLFEKREAVLRSGAKVVLMAGFVGTSAPRLREHSAAPAGRAPLITINDDAWRTLAQSLPEGTTDRKVSGRIPPPIEERAKLKNVIGMLRGADPVLKDSYVFLSAHYDHVGVNPRLEGDNIFNGANDDASGVAVLLEIARAISRSPERPRRTVVFAAWFGEEKGLLGSRFYVENPLFALQNTVANLNFEHMGRTDDNDGAQIGRITGSGFDYSEIGNFMTQAGHDTGVEAWKHPTNSDAFFSRSDNQAFADAGIPAHTFAVAWLFPDYHRPGDHWDKIDYENMQRVTRACALAAWRVAQRDEPPQWNALNPKTERYIQAWRLLTGRP